MLMRKEYQYTPLAISNLFLVKIVTNTVPWNFLVNEFTLCSGFHCFVHYCRTYFCIIQEDFGSIVNWTSRINLVCVHSYDYDLVDEFWPSSWPLFVRSSLCFLVLGISNNFTESYWFDLKNETAWFRERSVLCFSTCFHCNWFIDRSVLRRETDSSRFSS